jgi:hypothetical protein
MSETPNAGEELVRNQTFSCSGPVELDLNISTGGVDVQLDESVTEVTVQLRHASGAEAPWAEGVATVLGWVGQHFGEQLGAELRGSPGQAVQEARIEKIGNRLVVRGPKTVALRNTPLALTVHAPHGSHLDIRTGSAPVTVVGDAGRADVSTGSGEVKLDRTRGSLTVRTGSGGVRAEAATSGLQLRSGSGDVEVFEVGGTATVVSGTGDVWLGTVTGDVLARSGGGDLTVAEAASGSMELITGSGEIRVGVRAGTAAEVHLSSGVGRVSSELEVSDTPPEGEVNLRIRGRSGSGSAVVMTAGR